MAAMEHACSHRLPGVIAAMSLIRPLFDAQQCSVAAFEDRQVAEALLKVCPEPTDWWLSPQHLRQSIEQLQTKKEL